MSSRWLPRISRGGGGGGGGGDHQTYRVIVGNELRGDTDDDCDILDPGDGSGLASALAAASAGDDIFVRSGVYTLTDVTAPLAVPEGVRFIGAGEGGPLTAVGGGSPQTEIVGPSAGDQQIFTLAADSALEELRITNPTPTAETSGGNSLVTATGGGQRIARCTAFMQPNGAVSRTQLYFFSFADKSLVRIHQCNMFGVTGSQQQFTLTRGIFMTGVGAPAYITETVVEEFDDQVFLDGDNLAVSDGVFTAPANGRCIAVRPNQGAAQYRDVRITSCRFNGTGTSTCVVISPSDAELRYCLIDNCVFVGVDNNDTGISVGTGLGVPITRASVVRGCGFESFALAAISIESSAENTILLANEMSQSPGKITNNSATTESAHNLV